MENESENLRKELRGGVYAQDRWTLGKLTLSGGVRFDFQTVSFSGTPGQITEVGVSPRIGASYAFTPNLVAHAFFGLLWTPPSVLDTPAALKARCRIGRCGLGKVPQRRLSRGAAR